VPMLVSLLLSFAAASPCGDLSAVEAAASGGWLVEPQRECLRRMVKRGRDAGEASRLLLEDASARGDEPAWLSLAEEHVTIRPSDGDVWLSLLEETWRRDDLMGVVKFANMALAAQAAWATPGEDPRIVSVHRMRTYAAVALRHGVGLDDTLVEYATAWREAARQQAPAVASGDAP